MNESVRQNVKISLITSIFLSLFFGYLLLLPGISNEIYLLIAALFTIFILGSLPFLLGKSVKDDQHPYAYFARPRAITRRVNPFDKRSLMYFKFETLFYST